MFINTLSKRLVHDPASVLYLYYVRLTYIRSRLALGQSGQFLPDLLRFDQGAQPLKDLQGLG